MTRYAVIEAAMADGYDDAYEVPTRGDSALAVAAALHMSHRADLYDDYGVRPATVAAAYRVGWQRLVAEYVASVTVAA